MQQYRNNQFIGGVSVDFDRATAADFGQWSIQLGDFPEPDHTPRPRSPRES